MSSPELVKILAYLDFVVQIPVRTSLASNETGSHIKKVLGELKAKLGHQYTTQQIRSILWREFSQVDLHAEYNFVQLFLHGSSQLVLDPQTSSLVQKRLKLIQLHEPGQKRTSWQDRPKAEVSTTGKKSGPWKRNTSNTSRAAEGGKVQGRNTRLHQKKRKRKFSEVVQRVEPSSKHRGSQTSPTAVRSGVEEASNEERDRPPSAIHVIEKASSSKLTPCESVQASVPKLESTETIDVEPENEHCGSSIVHDEFLELLSELASYKQRYQKAEEKCHRTLLAMRKMESYGTELAKDLRQKLKMNSDLNARLKSQSDLQRCLVLDDPRSQESNAYHLGLKFADLKLELPTVHVTGGTKHIQAEQFLGASVDLDDLLYTLFPISHERGSKETLGFPLELTLYELIQMMTGAAIHKWIFTNEFRWAPLTVTPLLQKYRDYITSLCGHESLFQLDTAVHRSMIEEKPFQDETVLQRSVLLTTRLLNALQPLFDEDVRLRTTKKLRRSLQSILCLAIQIRAISLVGTEKYESVWPSIGSIFDANKMERRRTDTNQMIRVVRLPLCPGLQAYSQKGAVVDYQGFGPDGGYHATPTYVVKALVD